MNSDTKNTNNINTTIETATNMSSTLARRSSFTAANAYPFKIFKDKELLASIKEGRIIPIHVQINPTNVCNLNCSFCSCSKRDNKLSMDLRLISFLIEHLKELGCKAVTVTGGGEPILYKHFDTMIKQIHNYGIKIGLVSNGEALGEVNAESLNKTTWCRISCSDNRHLKGKLKQSIENAIQKAPNVDWAFSYVVTEKLNSDNMIDFIEFANQYNFTHVRVVSDLLNLDKIETMESIKKEMLDSGVDLSKVIFQGRKDFKHGQKRCLISLLKPNIGADGFIYPCCGAQYSEPNMALDYSKSMRMGEVTDILQIYDQQTYFDGSVCSRCYYSEYNDVLGLLLEEVKHQEFV